MSEQDDRNRFNTSSIDKATADRPASDSGSHPDTSAPKNISADDGAAKETLNILPTQNADAKSARTGADSRPHRTQSSSDNTLVNGKVHPVTRASARPADEEAGDLENTTKVYDIVHTTAEEQKKETAQLLKKRRKQKRLTIWAAILVVIVCINIIIAAAGIVIVQKMVADSPTLNVSDFVGEESSKIYDSKGNMIAELGTYLRENITYDQCPESLVDAFVSIEDSRYFQHFGFDIPRFTKAIIENLKNRDFGQGGSTFTMQLVKNTYFSVDQGDQSVERTKSIEYKVQQIYLAIKLEKQLDKKTIFQLYVNKLNFGGNIRGVQKASMYYFGKSVSELDLSESAMLAGIVNLPNKYNPYSYLDYATERRNDVLDMMCYHGYITQEECDLAKSIKVEDQLVGENRTATSGAQYDSYIDTVVAEAQKMTGKDPTVYGMNIETYMEPDVQTTVDSIQSGEIDVKFADDLMQVAMMCMNNQNGAIIAIGGGRNYDGSRLLNRATSQYKQPGSSVKPFLSYALAFEYLGYSMDEVLLDKPITYPGESRVLVNASGKYQGDVTIKDAVGLSLNIPAILTLEKVVNKIGSEKVISYLNSIGFDQVTSDNWHLSAAIGGDFDVSVYQMCGAHAMLINRGVYNQPHTIKKLTMTDGTEYYPENQNKQVLSSGAAYLACELMQNNVDYNYYNYMQMLHRDYPVYAKTGTTDWGDAGVQYGIPKGAAKDKWMISSTSQYTNAVWVGYDSAVSGKDTYFGKWKLALNIPGNINKVLLDSEETLSTEKPAGVTKPDDVDEQTYVYGTNPHAYAPDGTSLQMVTSEVAKANEQTLVSVEESYEQYAKDNGIDNTVSTASMSAIYAQVDADGGLAVTWAGGSGVSGGCSGGQRNISLHDQYNDIPEWGACLFDYASVVNNAVTGGGYGTYWATVYCDDYEVGQISSDTSSYYGWPAELYGTVKVCGGFSNDTVSTDSVCTVAGYKGY